MKKVTVYGSIRNEGDGSASIVWFLTEEAAEDDQENQSEGWGETCIEAAETFVGSNIHKEAVLNDSEDTDEYPEDWAELPEETDEQIIELKW